MHCYVHCLNLVLVKGTKRLSEAPDFLVLHCTLLCSLSKLGSCRQQIENIETFDIFSLMETLHAFLSRSVTHASFLKKQSELQPDCPQRQLQRLPDTRLSCMFLAVDALCSIFESVLATLEKKSN